MRKPITALALVAALGVSYWVYDSLTRVPALPRTEPAPAVVRVEPRIAEPPAAAPLLPAETLTVIPEPAAVTADDEGLGEHGHTEVPSAITALKVPPEQHTNDPEPEVGERAALEEARRSLEALLTDADPAVREEVSALLAVIAEAQAQQP
jgi:hypothetical protein